MRSLRTLARNWAAFLGVSISVTAIAGCGDEPSTSSSSGTSSGMGGSGGGSSNTGGMGTGGMGTGGMGTGGMGTGGMGTGGMGTGGMGTGGMGTGGMGTGGMGTGGMGMAVCGDGTVDGQEACDDGNSVSDDGCTDACVVSAGYACMGSPSTCVPICGDGMIVGAENCDDANTAPGDGCSATCGTENGYSCTGTPSLCSPICGDGMIVGNEICDGMNLNNQSCMSMGFSGGTLACSMMCTFNTSGCVMVENCNNMQDDDGDGQVDCNDMDCAAAPNCQPSTGATGSPCTNAADCSSNNMDPFCIDQANNGWPAGYCSEFCDLTMDDCAAGALCLDVGGPAGMGLCFDLCMINTDCRMGYECFNVGLDSVCAPLQEDCTNMVDDDQDGFTDCADSDCQGHPACAENICNDMVDNDQDGFTDCADLDCQGDPTCAENICNDMVDNDQDGFTDCADFDCQSDPACQLPEICSGGTDEDLDGWIDCEDSDCASAPGCNQGALCMGAISLSDGVPYNGSTIGGSDSFGGGCVGANGPLERIFVFVPGMMGQNGLVTITLSSASDQGIYVRADCTNPGSELGCTDQFAGGVDEQLVIPAQGGVPLSIFVDGYLSPMEAGPFVLTATFSVPVCGNGMVEPGEQCDPPDGMTCDNNCQAILPPETACNDLNDDDNDGLTDCEDPTDCKTLPVCQPGNTATGGICTLASDCVANNTDPFCIDANFGWPGGYCTEFCDLANDDCPAGSHCVAAIGIPSGAGLCFDECNTVMDCRAGYQCLADGSGTNICFFQ